jgi:hypothetical protein
VRNITFASIIVGATLPAKHEGRLESVNASQVYELRGTLGCGEHITERPYKLLQLTHVIAASLTKQKVFFHDVRFSR